MAIDREPGLFLHGSSGKKGGGLGGRKMRDYFFICCSFPNPSLFMKKGRSLRVKGAQSMGT